MWITTTSNLTTTNPATKQTSNNQQPSLFLYSFYDEYTTFSLFPCQPLFCSVLLALNLVSQDVIRGGMSRESFRYTTNDQRPNSAADFFFTFEPTNTQKGKITLVTSQLGPPAR